MKCPNFAAQIHWEQGQVDKVTIIVNDIMEMLPERLEDKHRRSDEAKPASLALVLAQEISMYNQLADVMHSTLTDVLDSLKGMYLYYIRNFPCYFYQI